MSSSLVSAADLREPLLQKKPPHWMVTVRCLALMGLVGLLSPIVSMLILGVYMWLMVLPFVIIALGVPAALVQWRWLQPAVSKRRFATLLTTALVLGAVFGFAVMLAADEAYRNLYTTLLAMALMSTLTATAAQALILRRTDRAAPAGS